MKHEPNAPRLSRRGLLGAGSCALAALAAAPFASACADPEGDSAQGAAALDYLPDAVAGIRIPGSDLARAAAELSRSVSSGTLYNHCMRTYLFAALSFAQRGVKFDEETTFVATALHDLGLIEKYQTPTERFEVDGADAARRFLEGRGVDPVRIEKVWDAIALHTAVGIANRKAPEIAAVFIGASLDATGQGLDALDEGRVAEVLQAFPRLGFKADAVRTMVAYCQQKPASLVMHPWAEVARKRIPGFALPTVDEIMLAAPFDE